MKVAPAQGRTAAATMLILAGVLTVGCRQEKAVEATPVVVEPPKSEASTPPRPASAGDLEARLKAAQAISSLDARDAALSSVAVQAATSTNLPVATSALRDIASLNRRDEAIRACAIVLARIGRREEATQLAQQIATFSLRDDTLSRIARE